ncbi:hypothetical protein [Aureimonas psammosilenae]|uniref:hypothetical protein n=1 Tax=Aureimonas psammosilenae TaxID=2495496 RepID=UPI001260F539|nr:hypothetical protein [Aureimonas psammosilenae]
MTSFVIWTQNEEDLGFLMFAQHDGEWPPAGRHDCMFTGSPRDPQLLNDPRSLFVSQHKGREWMAEVTYTPTDMIVRIDLDTGWIFQIVSNASGNTWTAVRDVERLDGLGVFL